MRPRRGANPHTWSPADRAAIGYLPQGHPVFSGTVTDNVLLPAPRGPADQRRLTEALTVAALEEDLAGMPADAATGIGEMGMQVSGGQRQRIALARALAASSVRPRLLVLDDPCSALDLRTEARILDALRAAVGPTAPVEHQATVLLVSTRLASFPAADLVVVLDAGRIAEAGTHEHLAAVGGLYARILGAQRHYRAAAGEPGLELAAGAERPR